MIIQNTKSKQMKRNLLVAAFFTLYCSYSFSQLPVFSKSAATYGRLTGATQVMKDSVWDDVGNWSLRAQKIPLGFSFQAFGHSIDTLLWEDGQVWYNMGDSSVRMGLYTVDLCDRGYGSSKAKSPIMWLRQGTAGNYIMKLEWRNFGFYDDWSKNGSCGDSADMQIWIYQNPQKVEMHFGPYYLPNFSQLFPDRMPVICAELYASGNSKGIALDGAPGSPSSHSFGDTSAHGVSSWPISGIVYVFDFSKTTNVETKSISRELFFDGQHIRSKGEINGIAEVKVYSANGSIVATIPMNNGVANVPELSSGFYFAQLHSAIYTGTIKFVVE